MKSVRCLSTTVILRIGYHILNRGDRCRLNYVYAVVLISWGWQLWKVQLIRRIVFIRSKFFYVALCTPHSALPINYYYPTENGRPPPDIPSQFGIYCLLSRRSIIVRSSKMATVVCEFVWKSHVLRIGSWIFLLISPTTLPLLDSSFPAVIDYCPVWLVFIVHSCCHCSFR